MPIYRNNRLGLAGRGINLRMIKANNKPGGPDTRHFMSPDTNQCQGYTPYVDSTATINQRTPGSGTQNQNRPCPCVSWSEDHKVKAPTKSGLTIGLVNQPIPKHTTNGSLPTPPINTTDVVTVGGQICATRCFFPFNPDPGNT